MIPPGLPSKPATVRSGLKLTAPAPNISAWFIVLSSVKSVAPTLTVPLKNASLPVTTKLGENILPLLKSINIPASEYISESSGAS